MTKQQTLAIIKNHRQLLPLFLLLAFCLDAFIAEVRGTVFIGGEVYDFTLTFKHYFTFVALGVNALIYFWFRPFYRYSLGITVALGLLNLLTFSAIEETRTISFNSLKLSFQPSAFWVGLFAYIINFKKVNNWILDYLANRQPSEEREKREKVRYAERVEKFKGKFENYSPENLKNIITSNNFVPDAQEAASQILIERKVRGDEDQSNSSL